jgi:hypothetical protein
MGAQSNDTDSNSGLLFTVGQDRVHVAIIRPQDLAVRNRVIETVLNLSSMRTAELVYLAAPRLLGATIDAGIFRSHGIGLLLFDDRRIDEAVPAQLVQRTTPSIQVGNDGALVTELTTLRAMYGEMERNLAQLREDMRNLHQNAREPERSLEQVRTPAVLSHEPVFTQSLPTPPVEPGALPSYFNNNPWLDVLSKRGRPEN